MEYRPDIHMNTLCVGKAYLSSPLYNVHEDDNGGCKL